MDRNRIRNKGMKLLRLFAIGAVALVTVSTIEAQSSEWKVVGETIVSPLTDLPGDRGHHSEALELKKLAAQVQSKRKQSGTEGDSPNRPLFRLPIRKSISNPYPNSIALSNYVDLDPEAPGSLLDWNCGDRTFDVAAGNNHNGVDYFNYPFVWLTMAQERTIAIAAADGTILDKRDGEPDQNCEFTEGLSSNQIAIEHEDGSVTVYTHLKTDTVTTKRVGDAVEQGDYLGVIGSSGFSTGPHLHFGVADSQGGLIEPHAGKCNDLNSESWWEQQEEYYESRLNLIATHDAQPELTPCPEPEIPHFRNSFEPGETVIFSMYFRDLVAGVVATAEILNPEGTPIINFPAFEYSDEHAAGSQVLFPTVEIPGGAPSGAYTYRVTFGEQVLQHTWYVNSGPNPLPDATEDNNAYNGLWFDPALDGEGYNFVTADSGTIVYFYGSDQFGNRLWLISDLIYGAFGEGGEIVVRMYESTGGRFRAPVASARGLSVWGTLTIVFTTCNKGTATLEGRDGSKVSQIVKLAGVAGTNCINGEATPDSPWSGLWYDTTSEGEGYNLIVAPNGAILYFYGFTQDGKRLWLISDLIVTTLEIDQEIVVAVYAAAEGTFDEPVPSAEALVQWGTATITLIDCTRITIKLEGEDGDKGSATVKLAGVIGLACED